MFIRLGHRNAAASCLNRKPWKISVHFCDICALESESRSFISRDLRFFSFFEADEQMSGQNSRCDKTKACVTSFRLFRFMNIFYFLCSFPVLSRHFLCVQSSLVSGRIQFQAAQPLLPVPLGLITVWILMACVLLRPCSNTTLFLAAALSSIFNVSLSSLRAETALWLLTHMLQSREVCFWEAATRRAVVSLSTCATLCLHLWTHTHTHTHTFYCILHFSGFSVNFVRVDWV